MHTESDHRGQNCNREHIKAESDAKMSVQGDIKDDKIPGYKEILCIEIYIIMYTTITESHFFLYNSHVSHFIYSIKARMYDSKMMPINADSDAQVGKY